MSDVTKSGGINFSALNKAVDIVAAYVSHNSLRAADLPELIASVHASISNLSHDVATHEVKAAENPAVAIKKSITKDHIVCLEDGKKFKSLRRHLSSFHNLTPDEYRAKWNLPSDYPMVAPAYSATRSQLAKESGLGQIGKGLDEDGTDSEDAPAALESEADAAPVKKAGRGRPRKGRLKQDAHPNQDFAKSRFRHDQM